MSDENNSVLVKYQASPANLPEGGTRQLRGDITGALLTTGGGSGGSTAPTTSVVGGAVYNVTKPTYTDGQQTQNQSDARGNLLVSLGTLLAGENQVTNRMMVTQQFSPAYISTATTTVVKSGEGVLGAITITESVASTIIVYDNTSGSGTILASFVASAAVQTYPLNVTYGTGLTVVTAGASKLTVAFI